MFNTWILTAAIVAVAAVSFSTAKDNQNPAVAQLRKDYEKINEYLEKNLATDNPELNMAKVEEMLNERSSSFSIFSRNNHMDTLKMLSALSKLDLEGHLCDVTAISLMQVLESGLVDKSRSTNRNYPLTRVNKIIEFYAYNNAKHCDFLALPKLDYALKQIDYDQINRHLAESLSDNHDLEPIMAKAEELLNSLDSRAGALARALEQFLELRYTLNQDTCNGRGYGILLRNDLATRGKAHYWFSTPVRRIDKIVQYYARQHEKICRHFMRKAFEDRLKSLDADTYRNVLGITSSRYLNKQQFKVLAEDLSQKQIDEDFTVPAIVEYAEQRIRNCPLCDPLENLIKYNVAMLHRFLHAMNAHNPEHTNKPLYETSGTSHKDGNKLERSAEKYLFSSCDRYLKAFKTIKEVDDYNLNIKQNHLKHGKGNSKEDLGYYMAREAYTACEFVNYRQKLILHTLKVLADPNQNSH